MSSTGPYIAPSFVNNNNYVINKAMKETFYENLNMFYQHVGFAGK